MRSSGFIPLSCASVWKVNIESPLVVCPPFINAAWLPVLPVNFIDAIPLLVPSASA